MIIVTGATGFLGSWICKLLPKAVGRPGRSAGLDLRDPIHARVFVGNRHETRQRTVIHCAYPHSNGIGTMVDSPADLVHDLLQIDLNVIDACAKAGVKKLICLGSVCAYPASVTLPTAEDQLWNGYPEQVNAAYGVAKRMQLELLRSYRKQYGLDGVQLILGNLYGPGDRSDHVIPATIRKVLKAKADDATEIVVWGDGTATREFLYVHDAAEAIIKAIDTDIGPEPVNVCSGDEMPIATLVREVMDQCDWGGRVIWDPSKPNGQARRRFSYVRAHDVLDWQPNMRFQVGLSRTIDWLRSEEGL